MNQPLVTCLCLTIPGRREFLLRAIDCFRHQTYENRELLIVADSAAEFDGLEIPPDTNIVGILSHSGRTIGFKRNWGCEEASGDLIAIWDDDDFSAPRRLEVQVKELEATSKAVTGFSAMKFTDGSAWWQFQIGRGFVIGSSLLFRRSWWDQDRFLDLQVGEDAGFCSEASEANQLAEVPDLNLMYATIHEGNTSKRDLSKPDWRKLEGFKWPGMDKGARAAWQKQRQ